MKIEELWDLLPDFEPLPPLEFMPPQERNRLNSRGIVGDGSVRWCACKVFQMYIGPGYFGRLIRPGDTVSLEPLWPRCQAVTRGYFHKNHHKLIIIRLAKADAYGYKCCFTFDTTPRPPFEVAKMFGLPISEADIIHRDNCLAAVHRRKKRYENLAPKSSATLQADSIARLI